MAILHFHSGEIISLLMGNMLSATQTATLIKTGDLEVIRLIIHAGKVIPRHKAPGEITVQCLEGRVAFTNESLTQELHAGQMLYLSAGESHSLNALEDSSLLVTRILSKN